MNIGPRIALALGLSLSLVAGFSGLTGESDFAFAKEKRFGNRGKGEGRKENWKKALQGAPNIAACRRKVEQNPESANAHNDLGWALRQNDQLEEAEKELRKALELDDTIPWGHSNLSVVLLDTGRTKEAVKEAERAVGIDGKRAVFRVVYGNALVADKQLDKAVEQYKAAVEIQPNYENALYHLGKTLYSQGKSAEAGAVLSQAIELDPEDHRVMKLLDKILK